MKTENLDMLVTVETLERQLNTFLETETKMCESVYVKLLEIEFLINIVKQERTKNE